jgi:hypothetical protein
MWGARLNRAAGSSFLSYSLVLLLQLRVIWKVWAYRDLTSGDTSSYFLDAASWIHGLRDDIVWSPLYTNFFGTTAAAAGDVPRAVMLHRVLIVLAAAVLVLAFLRIFLEPGLALFFAMWWVFLPPAFSVEYEVHLFGLLPILGAAIVAFHVPGRRGRGIAFAILLGTTLLLRNEMLIATILFGLAILVVEIRGRGGRVRGDSVFVAYAVPVIVVGLLFAGAYWRSFDRQVRVSFQAKQNLNLCQVYAFSYQQRHPQSFRGNPFIDCAPLMQRTFGRPMPSFLQATIANPGAMARYAAWNLRLLPSGLQVGLFDATSTGDTPGYFPVRRHRVYALLLSLVMLAVLVAGAFAVRRDWQYWRREWLPSRSWSTGVWLSVAVTTLVVALTQRPRPEYIYGLSVGLIALTGLACSALLRGRAVAAHATWIAAAVALVLCLGGPHAYHPGPRPLRDAVDRLQVVRPTLEDPASVLAASGYGYETCAYLAYSATRHCTGITWASLTEKLGHGKSLRTVLSDAGVTAIYVDPSMQGDKSVAALLRNPASFGLRRIAAGNSTAGPWSILVDRRRSLGLR